MPNFCCGGVMLLPLANETNSADELCPSGDVVEFLPSGFFCLRTIYILKNASIPYRPRAGTLNIRSSGAI